MDDALRKKIFEEFKDMISTESVVGQPIYLGDATIVPFVDISFGFGTGGKADGHEGGAGGGKVVPTAVLIMKGERIEMFSIKNATASSTVDKIINMVPEVISHFRKGKKEEDTIDDIAETVVEESTAADEPAAAEEQPTAETQAADVEQTTDVKNVDNPEVKQ